MLVSWANPSIKTLILNIQTSIRLKHRVKRFRGWSSLSALSALSFFATSVYVSAGDLDTIGVTDLLARDPSLIGTGIDVLQAEAVSGGNYQTNPSNVGQPAALFTYFDDSNPYPTGTTFQAASGHANSVGNRFFGISAGAAPGVNSVAMFEAGYFFNGLINQSSQINAEVDIVNQSFVFTGLSQSQIDSVERLYDSYAVQFDTLFVNGISNGGSVSPPSAMYNGIGVGASNITLSPPPDGRSKPDLIAPGGATSFTAPYVSGAAALLMQSGARNDAGTDTVDTTADATDIRTIKALLINGAIKADDWSNTSTKPLHQTYGAGMLNVNNSQLQLLGGQHSPTTSSSVASGTAHLPPAGITANTTSNIGWNLSTITNGREGRTFNDQVDHYYFELDAANAPAFDLVSTLVWNRQFNQTAINNLDLFLYNADNNAEVSTSISTVDNVEHLYVQDLAPGRYVLQVVKYEANRVSTSEDYALAFEFSPVEIPATPTALAATTQSNSSIQLSWTDNADNEDGYTIERSTTSGSGFSAIHTTAINETSYTDNGLSDDTAYFYRIKATNAAGDSTYSNEASSTTLTPLNNWRNQFFGISTNTGDAADSADPDFDGIANIVEYALGIDPTTATGNSGTTALPTQGLHSDSSEDYLELTVVRTAIQSGISYAIKVSNDLVTWTDDVTVLSNTATELKARDNVALSTSGRRFIRLEVTNTEE